MKTMTKKEWIEYFGNNLERLMYEKRISRKELAEKTYLTESTISRYLNKKAAPNIKAAINLSVILEVSLKDLIGFADRVE